MTSLRSLTAAYSRGGFVEGPPQSPQSRQILPDMLLNFYAVRYRYGSTNERVTALPISLCRDPQPADCITLWFFQRNVCMDEINP